MRYLACITGGDKLKRSCAWYLLSRTRGSRNCLIQPDLLGKLVALWYLGFGWRPFQSAWRSPPKACIDPDRPQRNKESVRNREMEQDATIRNHNWNGTDDSALRSFVAVFPDWKFLCSRTLAKYGGAFVSMVGRALLSSSVH